MLKARSWSNTPPPHHPSAVDSGQDTEAVFTTGEWLGGTASYLGIDVSLAHQLLSLIRTIAGWGLGQVCWEVSPVNRVQVKQVLDRQGMYRKQENGSLEWPDHTCR